MTMNAGRTNPHGPPWDQTAAYRRAVTLERERDALTREVTALRELVAGYQPVVDAAVRWHGGSTEDDPQPGRGLALAVAAYLRRDAPSSSRDTE